MLQRRFYGLDNRKVGKTKTLFNPEDWPPDDDHGASWDYVLTILGAFGVFVMLVTVGMMAWILGII